MLYRGIMAVCCQIHSKHINVELLGVKLVVYIYIVTTGPYMPADLTVWLNSLFARNSGVIDRSAPQTVAFLWRRAYCSCDNVVSLATLHAREHQTVHKNTRTCFRNAQRPVFSGNSTAARLQNTLPSLSQ